MPLQILSDADVRALLAGLTPESLRALIDALGGALHAYSVGGEREFQRHRQGVARPGGPTMLFMPATLADGSSVKVVGVPAPGSGPDKSLVGVVLVCDADGRAVGVLNAATLTAFRTALGSILLYRHRQATAHIVVFGAGKQALWHVWLALVLRRADIASVTIVNRAARAQSTIDELRAMAAAALGPIDHIRFSVLAPEGAEDDEAALKAALCEADVIFCTTPSLKPLFPGPWLLEDEFVQKTRFISAIGSYKLNMQELDPELLRTVYSSAQYPAGYYPQSDAGAPTAGGIIVVDSRENCAAEAGELVAAGVPDSHMRETGEVLDVLAKGGEEQERLAAWLRTGNVIYKSVGIGIMDLSIGRALLKMGAESSFGTTIPEF